ncbi:hypothetical protein B4144_4185 [Bacillus atrophaeus]|nr:hypothetical protein B4144_4185 [Bacillus atrophaeus]
MHLLLTFGESGVCDLELAAFFHYYGAGGDITFVWLQL